METYNDRIKLWLEAQAEVLRDDPVFLRNLSHVFRNLRDVEIERINKTLKSSNFRLTLGDMNEVKVVGLKSSTYL